MTKYNIEYFVELAFWLVVIVIVSSCLYDFISTAQKQSHEERMAEYALIGGCK